MRPALLLLASFVLALLPAQSQERALTEPKDPVEARRNSYYFAGAGHFYTGEVRRASAMVGVTLISGYKLIDSLGCAAASRTLQVDTGCSKTATLLWLGLVGGAYFYSIYDAPASAQRVNARNATRRATVLPTVHRDQRGWAAGVAITIALPEEL